MCHSLRNKSDLHWSRKLVMKPCHWDSLTVGKPPQLVGKAVERETQVCIHLVHAMTSVLAPGCGEGGMSL